MPSFSENVKIYVKVVHGEETSSNWLAGWLAGWLLENSLIDNTRSRNVAETTPFVHLVWFGLV